MGPVHYESNHNGTREKEALGGVEIKYSIVQNLDACWLLYETGDDIDKQEVDDEGGPDVVPLHFH